MNYYYREPDLGNITLFGVIVIIMYIILFVILSIKNFLSEE